MPEVLDDNELYTDVTVGLVELETFDGRLYFEKDYRVAGEVWRVHKSDADPFPSSPHAHCISGAKRYEGCTIHLGTGELFKGRRSLGKRMARKQFERLLELIQPKFPNVRFPLE